MSFSTTPGVAYVIKADNRKALAAFAHLVDDPGVTTILHNALYDLPVLARMGIIPFKVVDTMVGAYNLQRLPQGLKALAYRLCGMEMGSYEEAVASATRIKALEYLAYVTDMEWSIPEQVLTWNKGKPHVKQPQDIVKKVARIVKDVAEKGADPWERWHSIDLDEGRGMVEELIGLMVPGYLADIPEEQAVYYAARDADATLRIWPILSAMLKAEGLVKVFATDVATIPMISDMMVKGMRVDKPQLAAFSRELEKGMEDLAREISSHIHGEYINPDSPLQVSSLLFGELKLKPGKKTKGGAYYSTDDDIIKGLKD
ncbi:MAG: DNA polymerase, partial [Patescibacteria group bacterium]